MIESKISIPADFDTLHIILFCIIEHWRMPQYEERLSKDEFETLKSLRESVLSMRDNPTAEELLVSKGELLILIKAYEIGFAELKDADDFHTLVGQDETQGENVLQMLKTAMVNSSQ